MLLRYVSYVIPMQKGEKGREGSKKHDTYTGEFPFRTFFIS